MEFGSSQDRKCVTSNLDPQSATGATDPRSNSISRRNFGCAILASLGAITCLSTGAIIQTVTKESRENRENYLGSLLERSKELLDSDLINSFDTSYYRHLRSELGQLTDKEREGLVRQLNVPKPNTPYTRTGGIQEHLLKMKPEDATQKEYYLADLVKLLDPKLAPAINEHLGLEAPSDYETSPDYSRDQYLHDLKIKLTSRVSKREILTLTDTQAKGFLPELKTLSDAERETIRQHFITTYPGSEKTPYAELTAWLSDSSSPLHYAAAKFGQSDNLARNIIHIAERRELAKNILKEIGLGLVY